MLQVNRINKRYGYNQVLRDVTFTLNYGDHLGLVGANGSGKTTLLEIIACNLLPKSGNVIMCRGNSISYLPQNLAAVQAETIAESMLLAITRTRAYPTQELSFHAEAESLKLMPILGLGYLSLSAPLRSLSVDKGQPTILGLSHIVSVTYHISFALSMRPHKH